MLGGSDSAADSVLQPARPRGLQHDGLKTNHVQMKSINMRETANERLVREAARDIALEAQCRIRARLREVESEPLADRVYPAEWGARGRDWPAAPMPAWQWVSYLEEDLRLATGEFEACRRG